MDSTEQPHGTAGGSSGHEPGLDYETAENLIANASSLLKLGRFDEAEPLAARALELNGDGFDLRRMLGTIEREAKRPTEALQHFLNASSFQPVDAENLSDIGQLHLQLREYGEAISAFSAALEVKPDLLAARRGLAAAEQARGNDQAALDHFQLALSLDDTHSATHMGMANALKKLGRLDEAARSARDAVHCDPRSVEAHRFLAFLYRDRGDASTALGEFAAASDLAPRNVWFLLDVAAELRKLGRLDEAEAKCRAAIALEPEMAAAHRALGAIARERKDHLGAIAAFEMAKQYQSDDPWNLVHIGNEYQSLARYDEAIAQYREALVVKPDFAEPHRQIGMIERLRGNTEAALGEFIAARDLTPNNGWYHLDVVAELRRLGRMDEAEANCRRILDITPDFSPAHRTLGMIARERNDHTAALAHFTAAIQHDPADYWSALELANEYRMLERYDEAMTQYRAALAMRPDLAEPHRQIGMIERQRGNSEAALAAFAAARDLSAGNAWFHLDVVTELRRLGRLDEAEAACRRVLDFAPDFVAAHRNLGLIARDRKDHEAALAHFERALHYNPSDHWSIIEAANEYQALKRYDEALIQYRAAIAAYPDFAEAHRQIGMIERLRGNTEAALAAFVLARDLAAGNAWFHLDVVAELRRLGRLNEAEEACLRVLDFAPDFIAAHRALGLISRDRNDHEAALAHFERARLCDPRDQWSVFEAANEYRMLGRLDDAIVHYRAALTINPRFAEPHRQIAMIERLRGNTEAALVEFEAARDLAPDNAWFHLDVVTELRRLGRLDEAEACCRQVLQFAPDFMPAHRGLGFIARDRKDHLAAIALFENARQYDPADYWTPFEIANEYRTLERHEEAIAQYYAALALKPDFAEAHRQIGVVERIRGNEQAAIGHFEIALCHYELAAASTDGRASFAPIEMLLLLDRLDDAERRLNALENVRLDPEVVWEMHSLKAQVCAKRHDVASEVVHRRAVARLRPTSAWAWQALFERQIALNMVGAALADMEEALTHLPDDQDLRIDRARALRMAGRTGEALAELRNISLGERESAATYMRLANEYRNSGLYDDARNAAETAIRIAPHYSWAHLSLAFAILDQEGPAAGLAQFRREVARAPGNLEAVCQVSRLARESGNAPGARDFLLERGEGVRSAPRIFEELIVCLCQCDDLDRARDLIARRRQLGLAGDDLLGPAIEVELASGDTKKLAALVSDAQANATSSPAVLSRIIRGAHVLSDLETVIRTHRVWIERDPARKLHGELGIAEAEFRLGRQDQAMAILDSLKESFGESQDVYLTSARLLKSSGKLEAAAASLQDGLRKFPGHPVLWEEYVRLCILTNRVDEARDLMGSAPADSYMIASAKSLLAIELDLELRDIDGALQRIESFTPQYLRHRSVFHTLAFRACLAALDLPAARMHLASDIVLSRFDRKLRRQSQNVSQSLMGQILDDYRLDRNTVQDLIAIGKLSPDERTGRYFDEVRLNPDSTAAAITALIHLRRVNAFSGHSAAGMATIPKRIAQFWDSENVPPDISRYMETWRSVNEGWEYELYSSRRAGDFIRSTCPAQVATAFFGSRDATTKADLFRLAWLAYRGGVYVDADDAATGPMQEIMAPDIKLMAHQEDIGSVGNNFMGAVAGHPIIVRALAESADAILRGDRDMVWLSTGPGMMSRIFMQWLVAQPDWHAVLRNEILILDRGELTQVCAAHCQAAYKLTPMHWAKDMFG